MAGRVGLVHQVQRQQRRVIVARGHFCRHHVDRRPRRGQWRVVHAVRKTRITRNRRQRGDRQPCLFLIDHQGQRVLRGCHVRIVERSCTVESKQRRHAIARAGRTAQRRARRSSRIGATVAEMSFPGMPCLRFVGGRCEHLAHGAGGSIWRADRRQRVDRAQDANDACNLRRGHRRAGAPSNPVAHRRAVAVTALRVGFVVEIRIRRGQNVLGRGHQFLVVVADHRIDLCVVGTALGARGMAGNHRAICR